MKMATCHPEKKHFSKGLCRRCYNAAYRREHRPRKDSRGKGHAAWYAAHRDKQRAKNARRHVALKMEILNAYGGPRCACCGETLFEGLQIDHIRGDGSDHRKQENIVGSFVYRWLKKNGYPPGFQVLCGTCNFAKGTGDHCPHRDLKPNPRG